MSDLVTLQAVTRGPTRRTRFRSTRLAGTSRLGRNAPRARRILTTDVFGCRLLVQDAGWTENAESLPSTHSRRTVGHLGTGASDLPHVRPLPHSLLIRCLTRWLDCTSQASDLNDDAQSRPMHRSIRCRARGSVWFRSVHLDFDVETPFRYRMRRFGHSRRGNEVAGFADREAARAPGPASPPSVSNRDFSPTRRRRAGSPS